MNWETYLALGDSITIGARTYLGYPELVGDTLSSRLSKHWNVVNHAVSGLKTIDLSRHIDAHYTTLKERKASITTVLIGTNDIKERTSVENFRIALDQVLLRAKMLTLNGNVVVIAIPEFHKGISYPYSIGMNATIAVFNEVIASLAKRHGIRVLYLDHSEDDFTDGVHLNEKGIGTFSRQIVRYILQDKGIESEDMEGSIATSRSFVRL